MGEPGVDQQCPHAVGPDGSGADMLVTVRPGAQVRTRVVEMDHRQPIEADQPAELRDDPIALLGVGDLVSRTPQVGGVEADADPR